MQIQKPKQGYKLVKALFGKYVEIPEDWEMKKLEETVEVLDSQRIPIEESERNKRHGKYPYYGASGIIDYIDDFIFDEKLICFAEDGENLRSRVLPISFIIEGKTWVNNHAHVLKPKDNLMIHEYLNSYLNLHKLEKYVASTAQPKLTQKDMREIPIICPPVIEQQKIVSVLSNVDSLIQQTQKEIEQTQRLQKGLMQRLFTKGIGHTKFKEALLKFHFLRYEIPENWDVIIIKKLSTLGKDAVITGPFGLMLHSSDYVAVGIPLILIKNIKNGKIIDNNIPKVSKEDTERLSRYKVKEGDMVFSRVGRVGSAALVEKKQHGWLISGQLLRIRFDNPNLNSNYLNYFIQSHLFIRTLIPELLGSTRDSINTEILENLPILIPPKKEQDEITTIFSNMDLQIEKQLDYKSKLENLKKGLMQKLLTGQMRVKV